MHRASFSTVSSRALKPMMLKTCASHFQRRFPFIAVRYLKLINSPRAISRLQKLQFISVPLGAASDFVHFGSGKSNKLLPGLRRNAGSPSVPARQAVLLLGGACPARHGDFPGGQKCRITPAWSPQEACLSVSRSSCHSSWSQPWRIRAVSVVSAQLQLLHFQRECREVVWVGLCLQGRCSTRPSSLSRVPLTCRHLRKEGWVGEVV